MPRLALFALDLAAVSVLVFGLYFPRHRRRDLVVAFLGVNVGVLAVAGSLSSSSVGAGLGLGLFGVLSIIRLRSTELDQREVAYYFASLALGLLAGMGTADWPTYALIALLVVVMYVGDHPRLFRRYREQTVTLDRAVADETQLAEVLELTLGGRVHRVRVQELDLVNDTTLVTVRYEAERRNRPDRLPQTVAASAALATAARS